MKLLFVDACPRDEGISRTMRLCGAFLSARPDAEVERVRLAGLELLPYDGEMVKRRDALIDAGKLDDPMFDLARQFAGADQILIGAPYWDFSFPAMLKLYVEHIFARKITFVYTPEGEPVGLCRAERMFYLTTAGSPIGENNWGGGYMKAVGEMLGINRFDQVSAEGIDIEGNDVEAILSKAEAEARRLGQSSR